MRITSAALTLLALAAAPAPAAADELTGAEQVHVGRRADGPGVGGSGRPGSGTITTWTPTTGAGAAARCRGCARSASTGRSAARPLLLRRPGQALPVQVGHPRDRVVRRAHGLPGAPVEGGRLYLVRRGGGRGETRLKVARLDGRGCCHLSRLSTCSRP
ncbi:hypothetical protein VTK26DRAFT_4358 [Humicola hyalothermophila]